jgi:hypothetical protein
VALIAIGATMVGSITFSKKEGDYVKKGDEVMPFIYWYCFPSHCRIKKKSENQKKKEENK